MIRYAIAAALVAAALPAAAQSYSGPSYPGQYQDSPSSQSNDYGRGGDQSDQDSDSDRSSDDMDQGGDQGRHDNDRSDDQRYDNDKGDTDQADNDRSDSSRDYAAASRTPDATTPGGGYINRRGESWRDANGRRCQWVEWAHRDRDGYTSYKWMQDCRD